jgi:hypothetical protein
MQASLYSLVGGGHKGSALCDFAENFVKFSFFYRCSHPVTKHIYIYIYIYCKLYDSILKCSTSFATGILQPPIHVENLSFFSVHYCTV